MKTIYIARHAKSSWRNTNIHDIDRPLKSSGVIGVQRVAEKIKETEPAIDTIFTSPAARAAHTALIHARYLELPESRIVIRNSIYNRGVEGIYELVKSVGENLNSIMVVGHDPTLTNFVNDFLEIPLEKMQTSSVLKIVLDATAWSQIRFAGVEQLVYFNREETKELKYAKTGS